MPAHRTRRHWLALRAALSVFAVVLRRVVGAPTRRPDSAPLPEYHRQPPPAAMFGGSTTRNLVNLLDHNIPIDWCVEPGKFRSVKWVAELGTKAYGGPVIFDGKIFIGTNNGRPRDPKIVTDKGVVMCFEEKTGKFLWQNVHDKLPAGRVHDWPEIGIVSTPAVEGKRLYYVSNRGEVICASTDTGAIIWRVDMIGTLGVFPHCISSCSPLLVGDQLFVVTSNGVDSNHLNIPAPKASFLALDKKTGAMVWSSNLPTIELVDAGAGAIRALVNTGRVLMHGQWSNPVYAAVAGQKMIVFPGGDGWLYAFDPPTGKLLWKFDCNPKVAGLGLGRATRNHFIATPVVWEKKLYLGVGEDPEHGRGVGHLWCVDLERAMVNGRAKVDRDVSPVADNFDPKAPVNRNSALGWHYGGANPVKKPRAYHFGRTLSTCAVHDGLVYAAEYDGYLHCLDAATGQHYWEHDMEANTWCSPYWVDGKVYLGNENGEVLIFKHGKKKELLATIEMGIGAMVRTPPLVRDGVLYVVTENPCKLYAITGR